MICFVFPLLASGKHCQLGEMSKMQRKTVKCKREPRNQVRGRPSLVSPATAEDSSAKLPFSEGLEPSSAHMSPMSWGQGVAGKLIITNSDLQKQSCLAQLTCTDILKSKSR